MKQIITLALISLSILASAGQPEFQKPTKKDRYVWNDSTMSYEPTTKEARKMERRKFWTTPFGMYGNAGLNGNYNPYLASYYLQKNNILIQQMKTYK